MSFTEKIKKLEREIKRLRDLAYKDELTKIYNRRGFREEIIKFISQVSAYFRFPERRRSLLIKNYSLILFDIDNFKKINDKYGHKTGDEVLKFLAKNISQRVRSIDVVGRWGGEEIIVGLAGADERDAYWVAENIREKIEQGNFIYKRKKIKVTVSGGVASLDKTKTFEQMFQSADKALYRAKKTGKNKIVKASEL